MRCMGNDVYNYPQRPRLFCLDEACGRDRDTNRLFRGQFDLARLTMTVSLGFVWALLSTLLIGVYAQDEPHCSCFGLDYTNGGSYLVDGNSDNNFAFTSVFTGMSS